MKKVLVSNTWFGIILFVAGVVSYFLLHIGTEATSTDDFCASCHVHPAATNNWRLGPHADNPSGVQTHCVECHLPPDGLPYLSAKITTGARDLWAMLVKDTDKIDWQQKTTREAAVHHVYKASCIKCHQNLFPRELTKKGEDAHLYYERFADELRCINCHMEVGHYRKERESLPETVAQKQSAVIYQEPAAIEAFENFTEMIPGTPVAFEMVAVPGGIFVIGSPAAEPFRRDDEGPGGKISITPFWMGKFEVSWQEYDAYYKATHRSKEIVASTVTVDLPKRVDGVTGPTAPYGNPDQGWGRGSMPAITMTHYAAQEYCRWLSEKTGKTYRLPTEAEWEYACRAGTEEAYFFTGSPADYSEQGWINAVFGPDTAVINSFAIYRMNSSSRTRMPGAVKPNPFGLVNMPGNVREFCSDWYSPDTYKSYRDDQVIKDPRGPATGTDYVVRGGSFRSDAADLRAARRDQTMKDAWLKTDPQIPKSKWWYSDCNDVGFRVICEFTEGK